MTRTRRASLLGLALLGVGTIARADGRAETTKACVAAVEEGQLDRYKGHLRAARAAFLVCADAACPGPIRADCSRWLAEVSLSLPTAVIRQTWEEDAIGARVYMDGKPLLVRGEGLALPLDPGEHTFRFEIDGARPVETSHVIREGEKNRVLQVVFSPLAKSPAAKVTTPEGGPSAPLPRAPLPLGAYVAAGGGLLGIAAFVVLAVSGTSELEYLRGTCKTTCAPSRVTAARQQLLVGDIALGAGLVSLGAAAWLVLSRPQATATPPATRVNLSATPRGAGLGFETRF